ncbi:universal stress protein [Alteromonadaceae bacterium BrNp21-10]|nr:universal stress protein [Alteromonadaceae bacterium BrNp21-10]
MKIERILVIADQRDKQQKALARAKLMQEHLQVSIHVVGFCFETLDDKVTKLTAEQQQQAQATLMQQHQKWLQAEVDSMGFTDNVSQDVVWEKNIGHWVTAHCKDQPFDIIIKTGNRSETILYSPSDWQVLRNNQVPVLLVADKKWRKKQTIMVTLDLATKVKSKQLLNQKLLDAGIFMSNTMGLPLHVCCSITVSPILKDLGIIDAKAILKESKRDFIPKIKAMAGDYEIADNHIHIKTGDPEKVIPSVASDIAVALVIMGTVARKGLKGKVLGNTAEKVLALLKANILVIQP